VRLVLASRNEHKLRELRAILPEWKLEPLAAAEFPAEEGETFYENARAKARFGRATAGVDEWVVGEDSGLEVEGLEGAPGIRSARYAGPGASDEANVSRLLDALRGMEGERRRARYVCELVCLSPQGRELRATGLLAGSIAETPAGAGGFGYDPVFVPVGEARTVAALGDEWKREHSHRSRAARALGDALRAMPAEL
jgi:XTP/dITP diphosphohydrolase